MKLDEKRKRLEALDGWRTISVVFVIVSHLTTQSSIRITGLAANTLTPIFVGLGFVGVEIFFVISGFVICRGFLSEIESYGRISLAAFYIRRCFRILPMLFIYVFVIYALAVFQIVDAESRSVIRALTFTCNIPIGPCGGWLGGHTWSLSVEEQFYLIIPLVFIALSRQRYVFLAIVAVLMLTTLLLQVSGQSAFAEGLAYFCPIAIGVSCALNEKKIRTTVAVMPHWLFYCAFISLLLFARLHNTRAGILATSIFAVVIAYLLLASMGSDLGRWLSAKPLVSLGKASYGLYLWQQLAVYPFQNAGYSFYAISLSASVIVVIVSYHLFESPLIRLGAEYSRRVRGSREDRPAAAAHHPTDQEIALQQRK